MTLSKEQLDIIAEENKDYRKSMVKELSKLPKRPVSTVQCASMQAIIERDPSLDSIHSKRMIDPIKAFADKNYVRPMSVSEITTYESMRDTPKNQLGQSEKSATTPDRRENAIQAYIHTPPVPLTESQIKNLTKLTKIKELEELPKEQKLSIFEKIRSWFKSPSLEKRTRFTEEFLEEMGVKEKNETK